MVIRIVTICTPVAKPPAVPRSSRFAAATTAETTPVSYVNKYHPFRKISPALVRTAQLSETVHPKAGNTYNRQSVHFALNFLSDFLD